MVSRWVRKISSLVLRLDVIRTYVGMFKSREKIFLTQPDLGIEKKIT